MDGSLGDNTRGIRIVPSWRAVSRILSAFAPLRALRRDDHSSRPVIAHRLQQPTRKLRRAVFFEQRTRRASVLGRFPIWPCSVRGFACHLPYSRRGALLPHLFTLTFRLASPRLAQGGIFSVPLVLRVAPTGNYPAHCPAEFGLSSLRLASPQTRSGQAPRLASPRARSLKPSDSGRRPAVKESNGQP